MHFRLMAPLLFAALTLAAPSAFADSPRRLATVPAAHSRPRSAEQPRAPRAAVSMARPAPSTAPTSTVVVIEVREIRAGARTTVERFSIPVGERGVSRIESRMGEQEYRISVHRDGSAPTAPLGFDIRKSEWTPKIAKSEARVSASVRMSSGQPVIIAAMDRTDGSRTEVLAELK